MFIGSRQERELMQARERYWHDQASLRASYEKKFRIMEEEIRRTLEEANSLLKERDSILAETLNFRRDSIAQALYFRFGTPVQETLARLKEINSSETLRRLFGDSFKYGNYDDFLVDLSKDAA